MGLLYTSYKVLHYKDKIESLPKNVDKIMPPIHIRLKPTNVCAHNCWYCAYKADNLQLGKDMDKKNYIPKEKMMEIMDDIIEMGVKAVTFSGGGDPFYYPYLLDTVKKLVGSPVKFASLTNGAMLKGELAELFAHHGTWLRISIDGWDAKSYADYRGVPLKEFDKVMTNLENFQKLNGNCYLGVSYIVDNKNYKYVYDSIKRFNSLGVDSVKVSPCIVSNDGKENNEYHKPLFDAVKEQTARAKSDFHSKEFEIFDSYHELDEKFTKPYDWCPYLQILTVIGADCKVYSCQDKAYNLDEGLIGDFANIRFKDFWMNNKQKFFDIDPTKLCNHHCVANNRNKIVLEYLNTDPEHMAFV